MRNNLEKIFADFINEGAKAASLIQEPDKKAQAYAALATAIARTGYISPKADAVVSSETETKTAKTGKDSIKKGANKTKAKENKEVEAPVKAPVDAPLPAPDLAVEETKNDVVEKVEVEPVENTTAPAEQAAQEDAEEWTEEMTQKYANELADLDYYVQAWGEDYVYNTCVGEFLEWTATGSDQVRPTNIVAFVSYLYTIYEEAQKNEQQ